MLLCSFFHFAVYARIREELAKAGAAADGADGGSGGGGRGSAADNVEEFEDSLGNVLTRKTYMDLAKAGLL